MNSCEQYLSRLEKELPSLCDINDLIRSGIVKHRNTMANYRKQNIAPPCIRASERRFLYPREGLLEWLKDRIMEEQV